MTTQHYVTDGTREDHDGGDCRGDGHGGSGRCRDARTVTTPGGPGDGTTSGVVAVAAAGPALTDAIDEHFGRAACLQLIDLATLEQRVLSNDGARQEHHGAGISAVELVSLHSVHAVIATKLGPKAVDAFRRARIPVYGASAMSVAQAVAALTRGELPRLDVD